MQNKYHFKWRIILEWKCYCTCFICLTWRTLMHIQTNCKQLKYACRQYYKLHNYIYNIIIFSLKCQKRVLAYVAFRFWFFNNILSYTKLILSKHDIFLSNSSSSSSLVQERSKAVPLHIFYSIQDWLMVSNCFWTSLLSCSAVSNPLLWVKLLASRACCIPLTFLERWVTFTRNKITILVVSS